MNMCIFAYPKGVRKAVTFQVWSLRSPVVQSMKFLIKIRLFLAELLSTPKRALEHHG